MNSTLTDVDVNVRPNETPTLRPTDLARERLGVLKAGHRQRAGAPDVANDDGRAHAAGAYVPMVRLCEEVGE